ncbi:MAG: hypothetical protein HWE27_19235 [Gammaproteobacteria bacterium]|nr:hypothetical protein [Gammaproteobacteria bacterium]
MFNYGHYIGKLCDYRFSYWYACFALLMLVSADASASSAWVKGGYDYNTPHQCHTNSTTRQKVQGLVNSLVGSYNVTSIEYNRNSLKECHATIYYTSITPNTCSDNSPLPSTGQCGSCSLDSTGQYYCEIPPPPTCSADEYLDTVTNTCLPVPTCPDSGTFYKTLYGRSGFDGYSSCLSSNCVVQMQDAKPIQACTGANSSSESCNYDVFYTGQKCTYDPNNTGMQTPDYQWPDTPTHPTGGTPTDPDIPTDTNPEYNPDAGSTGDDTSMPNPNPTPDPDNPNLTESENDIVGGLSVANQHLENITFGIDRVNASINKASKSDLDYQKHILGQLKTIADKPTGGGGGTGTDPAATAAIQDIKCLLDDNCEAEGKEKPYAEVNCSASIFDCKGDVIQCALLKIEYENSCAPEELAKLKEGFEKVAAVDNVAMLVQDEVLDFSNIDTKYLDNGVRFNVAATCPTPASITVEGTRFYSAQVIEFSFTPACKYAELIRPLVILSAWLAGLFIIGRSQGMV